MCIGLPYFNVILREGHHVKRPRPGAGRDVTRGRGAGARPRVWCTCAAASAQGDPRFTEQVLRAALSTTAVRDRFLSLLHDTTLRSRQTGIRSNADINNSCAPWNLWQHPVDANAPRSSPLISVVATDKTNRYASSARHREYLMRCQIFVKKRKIFHYIINIISRMH